MEKNVAFVRESRELKDGAAELVGRAVALAQHLLEERPTPDRIERGGRKAHRMTE